MKQQVIPSLTVVQDHDVIRAESEKAAANRASIFGARVRQQQEQASARKAARRTVYKSLERIVSQDDSAAQALEVLRSSDGADRPGLFSNTDSIRPRLAARHPDPHAFSLPGTEETLLFASDHYSRWAHGEPLESGYNHSAATDFALRVASDDGDPDQPWGWVGFDVAVQTSEHIEFLEIRPLMRYQFKSQLTSSTSVFGDGEAQTEWKSTLRVLLNGNPITDWTTAGDSSASPGSTYWQDNVSGSSHSVENDGWVGSDFSTGFGMTPGVPYVVEVGLYAKCDSSCYGGCGGANLDVWGRLLWIAATGTVVE
ncbi:MAG: hypothetical protein JWN52_2406 [Actinomycetia bacterium]|nr:hypothetical protein [Actinomycetes bacterium]